MFKIILAQNKNKIKAKKQKKVLITQVIFDKLIPDKKNKKNYISRYLRYYKLRILRLKENPQTIARGFALGVFSGCLPLLGLQFLVSFLLAVLFRANKFTALIGTWISNPITYVPLFLFNFKIGKIIINLIRPNDNLQLSLDAGQKLTNLGQDITIALFLGSFVVGSVISSIAYYSIIFLLKKWKKT